MRALSLQRAVYDTLICSGEQNNQRGQRSRKTSPVFPGATLVSSSRPVRLPRPTPILLIFVLVLLGRRIVPAVNVVVAQTLDLLELLLHGLSQTVSFLL